ncbi:Uncharacterized protein SAPIO_CDS10118 [Scedosporium apiospermum]|uniref:SCP domain-containing protein n=1 Tax=Pseudallescheria apiosperma TaxID=563466 RepID=A0A084FWE7_PSEDA|nr:Uncharacterized protein SAPIO_CDS10118 [Scedosporium apiospermum]KEZ39409.1 Uncharacterized protein SAPIO_CDS10118 [Scedosporium apiospermum]
MKASLALAVANAMLALASPVHKRLYVTDLDIKTVTVFVYPDGSPATHLGPQPTDKAFVVFENIANPQPTPEPQPEPTPAPAPEPEPEPAPVAEPEPAPVVETPVEQPTAEQPQAQPEPVQAAPAGSAQEASLNAHNVHRSNHSAPAVTWDSNLASYAQQLANTCNYGHDTKIGGGGYGQNIAMSASTGDLPGDADALQRAITGLWYNDEFSLYPSFGANPDMTNFEKWGHLSQIVWASTTTIGCAISYCEAGQLASGMRGWFAVCNYGPAGNVPGAYAENVKVPLGNPTVLA